MALMTDLQANVPAGALPERRDTRLTHSRLQCAKTCLRKHYLLYVLGLRPDHEAQPLRMGRVFHRGLELAETMERDDAILAALAGYDAGPPDGLDGQAWWVERETVARLLAAHIWRWSDMDAEIAVLATEEVFGIPLRNPRTGRTSRTWTLAGKRDKLVRLADGRVAILEYKTTAGDIAPDSDYWKRLLMDAQVSIYWLAAEDAGIHVDTVLYDVTRKPSIRPRQIPLLDADGLKVVLDAQSMRVLKKDGKPRQSASTADGYRLQTRPETPEEFGERLTEDIAEQPDKYFSRREIPRLQSDLDEARYELWQYGRILAECQRNNRWPRNTGACNGFGRCTCWGLCTGGFDLAEGVVPEGWSQTDDVHQELVEETEQ